MKLTTHSGIRAEFGTQGTGALQDELNEIAGAAGANAALTLPSAEKGRQCTIINNSGQTLVVYPALGDSIIEQAVNTSVSILDDTGRGITFFAYDNTNWGMSDVQWR